MRVLVACEFSGVVRDAFADMGHDAMSCDLLPSEFLGPHYRGDVLRLLRRRSFDLMVAHPPCQFLTVSGNRWFKVDRTRRERQVEAFEFVMALWLADVPRVAIENPIGVLSSRWRKPDQVVQPWMFGHPERKATCLWLRGLAPLVPTRNVKAQMERRPARLASRVHHAVPGPDRWRERSRTLPGLARAMAEQWGRA